MDNFICRVEYFKFPALELNTSNSTQYSWEVPKVELMLTRVVPNTHLCGLVFLSPIFDLTKVTNFCWKHTFTYIETNTFYIENMYVLTKETLHKLAKNPPPNQLFNFPTNNLPLSHHQPTGGACSSCLGWNSFMV